MEQATRVEHLGTAWSPGAAIGRYTLVAKIAVGGMAEIWLARQAGLRGFEKVVVIKKVSDAFTTDPEFVDMFLDEARIAAQLNHPHIVQIYDLGEQAGSYYIAMEYLPGENLAAVMRQGFKEQKPIPLELGVRVIANTADALAHAHVKTGLDGKPLHIVHRDVSPQNLIITYEGVLKVVDFGIAKAANRASHTVGNQLKGKMGYLSPEQARSMEVDARSDVFALGIILFEVVTRTRLFHFEDPMRALLVIGGNDPLPTARSRNAAVPETLEAIISKALERDPQDRFQSARDFMTALEEWLRATPEPSSTSDVADYMRELFAERIAQREKLFEQALKGDLTPSGLGSNLLTNNSQLSMPGATQAREGLARRRFPVLGLAAAGALLLGVLGALGLRAVGNPAPAEMPRVDVQTEPPGAEVVVDGARQGTSPLSVELGPGQHEVVAALPGWQRASRVIHVQERAAPLKVTLTLAQVPAAPPPAAAPPAPQRAPEPPPAQVDARAKPSAPVRRGKLSLDTTPWTRVTLNGKELGDTPLVEVSLPAGRHVLHLSNEGKGINSAIEVEIEPGRTTTKRLKL